MNLPRYSVQHRPVVLFAAVLLAVGGLWSYAHLGKLEDPEFTIKTALVVTEYPGASPAEVEEQVTEVIERAVQQLDGLDHVRSISRAGLSLVHVEIRESFRKDRLPQVWDELRRKVHDVRGRLPQDAKAPAVRDDFGDVYGVLLALTGDGFSYAELKDYADLLQRELLLVEDVARVETWGTQIECIYVEFSRARLAELGVHPQQIVETLQRQNQVLDAGAIDVQGERIRLAPSGTFQSVEEIGDLVIHRGSAVEAAIRAALPPQLAAMQGTAPPDLVRLRDVAAIERGYLDPPLEMMRFNGRPAIGLAISTVPNGNVLVMGDAVQKRIGELLQQFPVGIDVGIVAFQADNVREAVGGFVTNLIESVVIVVGVLLVTMGLRSGLLIGSSLIFSILGTLIALGLIGVDLQRTSLGAFIIAMGMLVDNAIVVTEGALIRLQRGEDRTQAVVQPAADTAWPLLGATLVAILAFLPIYLANDNTGEYCESLFLVVGISLGLSWILAMTQTPVFSYLFLRVRPQKQGTDPYAGWPYQVYKRLLEASLRHRAATLVAMAVLLALSVVGFRYVDQIFFPSATRAQFMIDYGLPAGARIQNVAEDLRRVEAHLLKRPEVTGVATFIGAGPPRFYLPYEPELPDSSYGQILVNVKRAADIDKLVGPVEEFLKAAFPQAEPRVRRFALGPTTKFEIEARFSGPDPQVLRALAEEAKRILRADPFTKDVRDDWRQPVKTWVPVYSQPRARRGMISRTEMALSLQRATTGLPVALYREDDELLPILVRAPEAERRDVDNLAQTPVWGHGLTSVPLEQLVSEIEVRWEDPLIHRRNRRPTITVQCDPQGILGEELLARIRPRIESIPLPAGYTLEWGGQHEKSVKAQAMLLSRLPVALLLMALIVVALFNSIRQPLIILLVLPFSMIGVTAGLLLTGQPFGFLALVGALSLFGMLIKNAVVLLDQIDMEIRRGVEPYRAVVTSSISRMRPVLMASLTTVLGMLPLVWDALFNTMAITIMFGLAFATVLTLVIVPVLYVIFFRIHPTAK